MRVRIDKSRKDTPSTSINNLGFARVLLDLIASTNDIDPAIADKHSAIANDPELRHLSANAGSFRTRQCDELRSVKNGEGAHEFKTAPMRFQTEGNQENKGSSLQRSK